MEIAARSIAVGDESRVAEARRVSRAMAASIGFNDEEAGRVAIVATELSTNLLKHGGGGELLLSLFDDGEGAGVECLSVDKGRGIANLDVAMRDGHSTAGSPGTGLGAISRQSHVMDFYSQLDHGTAILARLHRGDPAHGARRAVPSIGAISLPKTGEEACGDAWTIRRDVDGMTIMVVDGLGHGPMAASAAHTAVTTFSAGSVDPSARLIERLNLALRPTRGAAASVAHLPFARNEVVFVGVGNVAGVVMSDQESRRMVSYNGTLGHAVKTVRPFTYPTTGETWVILASDGLGTSWSLDSYPGLKFRHPSLIAAVLYRDFSRGRDDVTVVVARRPPT